MPNLYGVANAPNLWVNVLLGGPVTLTANTETNFLDSGALIAPSNGWYYPVVWLQVCITYGTPIPTNTFFAARIGAGADFLQYGMNNSIIVAAATQMYSLQFVGPASTVPWQGAGSHVFVSGLANTTAATVSQFGTWAHFWLMRAPDQ